MFYVCKGSCLCGTVKNTGKVIYCYGEILPRNNELLSPVKNSEKKSPKDLLVAQLAVWICGLLALFVLLLLIRKSITSLRKHIERVTDRLPKYHDHEDMMSPPPQSPSLQHKDTTLESIVQFQTQHSGWLHPDLYRSSAGSSSEQTEDYSEQFHPQEYFVRISPSVHS